MVSLLSKIFIKDRFNYSDKNVRHQCGMLCGFFGIFWNLVLFAFKAFAGFITKSIAVTAKYAIMKYFPCFILFLM